MPDPAPRTRRINRGRGHSYELRRRAVDGVTTILGNGVPKPALIGWAFETASEYAVDHWDELAELGAGSRASRKLEKARYETTRRRREPRHPGPRPRATTRRRPGSRRPRRAHRARRRLPAVHPRLAARGSHSSKAIVANAACRYMGTLDLVAKLADGRTWLLDWKTGGKGIFREAALQLAAYRTPTSTSTTTATSSPCPQWTRPAACGSAPTDTTSSPSTRAPRRSRIFRYVQQVALFTDESPRALHPRGAPARQGHRMSLELFGGCR